MDDELEAAAAVAVAVAEDLAAANGLFVNVSPFIILSAMGAYLSRLVGRSLVPSGPLSVLSHL